MSKILKRFLVILMILIGAIIAIPKLEQASVDMKDSDYIYGCNPNEVHNYIESLVKKSLKELKEGDSIYVVNPWIVNNKNIFCIQERQHLTNGEWKITDTIEIDSNSDGWAQGLAYLLDKAEIGVETEVSAWTKDNLQLAIWSYLDQTENDAMQFFGNDISMALNNDHSDDNDYVGDLVHEAMQYYSGQKRGTFKGKLHIMRYVPGSNKDGNSKEDDFQTVILIEKTEPEPTPFEFDLEKIDEDGNRLDGAKFDVEITGVKNVTVDGNDYSSYKQNITVDGIKSFTNIKQDPNAAYIKVTVQETEAPSPDYEIDATIHTKYFRYNNDEWQEWKNGAWTKYNGYKFTIQVKNKLKLKPPMEIELEKVDENGIEINGAKFDVEITGVKNVTVDGNDYSSYKQNITVDGTKMFTDIEQDPNADYITVTIQETDAPSDDFEIDPTKYTKYFRYDNNEWQEWKRKRF